jgi:hypothetical protein
MKIALQADLVFLRDVFKQNGYNNRQIHRARQPPSIFRSTGQDQPVAFLPFVGTIFNRISRMLARHNKKSVGLLHMKLSSLLRLVKDHLELMCLQDPP